MLRGNFMSIVGNGSNVNTGFSAIAGKSPDTNRHIFDAHHISRLYPQPISITHQYLTPVH
jgi:hypothetical protein